MSGYGSGPRGTFAGVDISFISSVSIITSDITRSADLYVDALGLPLTANDGDEYLHSEQVEGTKHFGVWPLSQAAEACFGTTEWPSGRPVPQTSVEFDVPSAELVQTAADELRAKGFDVLHDAQEMPWGQTVARLQSGEGVIIGISFAPWMH